MSNVIEFVIKGTDKLSGVIDQSVGAWSRMEKVLAAASVTASIYATINLAKKSLNEAEAIGMMAKQVGTTAEKLSALSFAASQSGSSAESLTASMRFLNRAMAEGATSEQGRALEHLGVAARDASGALRPVDEVFLDLADKFAASKDDANKTAAAMTLLGRAGVGMVPMLNEGRAGLEGLMNQAKQLGLVVDNDFAKSADNLNDRLELVSRIGIGAMNGAMKELAPVMDQLLGQFVNWVTESGNIGRAGAVIGDVFRVAASGGAILFGVLKALGEALGGVAATMVQLFSGNFKGAWESAKGTVVDFGATMKSTATAVGNIWDEQAQKSNAATAKQMASLANLGEAEAKRKQGLQETADLSKNWLEEVNDKWKEAQKLIGDNRTKLEKYEETLRRISELKNEHYLQDAQAAELVDRVSAEYQAGLESQVAIEEERHVARMGMLEEYVTGTTMAIAQLGTFSEQMTAILTQTTMATIKSVGDAFGQTLAFGGSLLDALGNVAKRVIASIISSLVQYGVQRLILGALNMAVSGKEAAAGMAKAAAETYGNSFASAAAIPMVGWAMAPGVAAANLGLVLGGMGVAAAAGGAMGAATAGGGIAHGGMDFVPRETTYLLDRGERVLSPRQNQDLTSFLDGPSGGGTIIGTLNIHLMENAVNAEVFSRMNRVELRNALGQPIIDALNEMNRIGVRPA